MKVDFMLEDKICGIYDVTCNTREADADFFLIEFPSGNSIGYIRRNIGFSYDVFTYQTRDGCFMP